jgi:polyisoprenoid-binding protein YceI
VVIILAVGGPFVYIHFIEGPAPSKLSLPGSTNTTKSNSDTNASVSSITGTWRVSSDSIAGYRVEEVLLGQKATAVGRTTKISGSIVVSGSELSAASFTVDMASVKSDQSERNAQFDGRIMDVAEYPTAKFTQTSHVTLGRVPGLETITHVSVTGELTMHGATRSVTLPLTYERMSDGVNVLADLNIVFSRWNIANPSISGIVTTANNGTLEVLLNLTRGPGNAPITSESSSSSESQLPPGGGAPVTIPSTTIPQLSLPGRS